MLNLICEIKFTQQPTADYPSRSASYSLDFVNEASIVSTWENLSDTAELVLPQKIYFLDQYGKKFSWQGKNIGGGVNTAPIIMRGDKVSMKFGYEYYDTRKKRRVREINEVFAGYVSQVQSKKPMTISCVDNMWKLSQIEAPNKTWTGYTLQGVLKELLAGTGFTLKDSISGTPVVTKIQPVLVTQNQTVLQVLEMIQRNYKIESFFRGNVLYSAAFRYWTDDVQEKVFRFQENIIEDDLKYSRTDDVQLGIQAYSFGKFSSGVRKDGKPKNGLKRYECFAIYKRGKLQILDAKPAGWEGELRTLNLAAESLAELKDLVQKNAYKLIYDGFVGSFTTFGLPYVRHGDNIILRDAVLPDRNGTYKCKKNEMKFGMNGFRQVLHVDMRVDTLTDSQIKAGI